MKPEKTFRTLLAIPVNDGDTLLVNRLHTISRNALGISLKQHRTN